MISQPCLRQITYFNVIFTQKQYVPIFPCISSETPSLPPVSFPPIQFSPVVFWKGGYIHCYCMISQNLSSQPLKQGRADRSWVIPAVSPSLGKTWVNPSTRTLPSPSYPSTLFLLLHATGTNLCQLNRFSMHFWGAHKVASLLKLP